MKKFYRTLKFRSGTKGSARKMKKYVIAEQRGCGAMQIPVFVRSRGLLAASHQKKTKPLLPRPKYIGKRWFWIFDSTYLDDSKTRSAGKNSLFWTLTISPTATFSHLVLIQWSFRKTSTILWFVSSSARCLFWNVIGWIKIIEINLYDLLLCLL